MPTPTTETLATFSSQARCSKPTSPCRPSRISWVRVASRRPTVNSMLAVLPVLAWDWTIMSTFTLASAKPEKIRDDTPGWSGTPYSVILASSRL